LTATRTWTHPNLSGTYGLTTNDLSIFAATTSAQLLGVLSDETGTGAAVFASSPTLVTPALGAATATSLAIGGGTAIVKHVSVVVLNLDIGAASANQCVVVTTNLAGVTEALGDMVSIVPTVDDAAWDNGSLTAFVESADVTKVVWCTDADATDPDAGNDFRFNVWQY